MKPYKQQIQVSCNTIIVKYIKMMFFVKMKTRYKLMIPCTRLKKYRLAYLKYKGINIFLKAGLLYFGY